MSFVGFTLGELRTVGRSIRRSVTERGPERETAVQSLKAAAAAVLAWALAGWWWHAPFALLAPWTALFLVQDTVYRSLVAALQQFTVVMLGTLLAALAGVVTGDTLAALALALPATVLLGTYARFGAQGLYAPTAALFVIAYGSYGPMDIVHRLLETALGAAVGLCVNALVLPPVHDRRVRRLRRQLAAESARLLTDAADRLATREAADAPDDWDDRARWLGDVLTDLRTARRWSDESLRLNPLRRLRHRTDPGRTAPPRPAVPDTAWYDLTDRLLALMRALMDIETRPDALPPDALDPLLAFLRGAALAVSGPDDPRTSGARPDASDGLDRARRAHRELLGSLASPGALDTEQAALRAASGHVLTALERARPDPAEPAAHPD
ncbi:FUSC family protein [Streptomyces arenae]|uniref:FUSC family protein n=1 Tax=Streptomyces arenae TaxID=29301 RepID=UPI002659086C|nr:aromatic acid exporter family protein [Streptomyces arenae]MCG7207219.1 aromatic acid exporter family protein [Streptomyces arenae]